MVADLSLRFRTAVVNKLIHRGVEDRFDGNLADNYFVTESRVSLYCKLNKRETLFDLYRIIMVFCIPWRNKDRRIR